MLRVLQDGTPLGEKVFLLEQRLRDAQAEKEIAVDIVKDELAQEKSRSVELSSTVESQAKVIGELNLKLESLEIGASTNTNERERLAQLDHSLKELERKSKAEAEVSATRIAQLENELSMRESEMNGLREAAAEAKSEVGELRRLAEDTGALRQQEDKLVSDYRERIEGLQEQARAVPHLKAEVAALTTRASELSTALHTRDEEARKQEHLVEEQRSRTARLESRVEQLQLSLEETSARAESFQQVAERDAALCQQLRCQLREQEEQSAQSQQELKECQVRIAQLQADTAAIEGLKNTAAEAESNIRQLKDRNEQQEEELEQRKCFRISKLSGATHAEELEKLSTEKAAQKEAMEEKLRTADNEIQRHKEEMKGIRSQLAHGLKVEKELLQTRAALEESKKIRDEQAEELASKAKAVAAYEEENARLSSRSADLEQRVQSFESSEAELRAMHEKARAEGIRQLEEIEALRKRTDQQQIDLEISKKALADSERKLDDVAGPAHAVEDLKACLSARESEVADLKSHIEEETSAREAEKEQIRVANASEMEGLRRTLETAYTSEKAQMQARLSEAKDELASLQERHDSATAELDTLRAAAAVEDATAEDLSKMQSSTLESVLADQQLCFNNILAALHKASLSSQGLTYSTTLGPPPQASFGGSIPTGVSSAHSSVPGSPDPEMAWYSTFFTPFGTYKENNHPARAPSSANVYSMNDEVERIDTAAAAVPHDASPQDGVMISRRVSEVVERLIEQLREAQRGRLRIESELEECQRELDLRRAEAARPYFAESARAFGTARAQTAPLPPRPVDFEESPLWKLRQPLVPQDEWVDLEFERMGLQEAPVTGQVLSSSWKGDAAPSLAHPMWPNPSLEMARAEPFTPLASQTNKTEPSPLVKAQIGRNRARLDALWKLSSSHGISWDELDDHFVQWHAEYTHRTEQFKENLDKFRMDARDAALPYMAAQKLKFHVRRGGSWTDGLPPFAPKRIRRQGEKFLHSWRKRYIAAHFQPGNLTEYLKNKVTLHMVRREVSERCQGLEKAARLAARQEGKRLSRRVAGMSPAQTTLTIVLHMELMLNLTFARCTSSRDNRPSIAAAALVVSSSLFSGMIRSKSLSPSQFCEACEYSAYTRRELWDRLVNAERQKDCLKRLYRLEQETSCCDIYYDKIHIVQKELEEAHIRIGELENIINATRKWAYNLGRSV
ncbi:hypothetical protein FOZ61_010171 [Perkinsus olseni]|uniref:Uncharacterized protein n=1 Tax=Perkinsus olseni TaxID=32597 RepID=A0A7J6MHA9_PEROL|nr:hypothetical protein FOZ61_010171 [Perkinsus olseni]